MTQQDDITQRVLTAEHHLNELMRLTQPWPNATIPCATVRSHVEQALSKLRAPVADERAAKLDAECNSLAHQLNASNERNGVLRAALSDCSAELFAQCGDQSRAMSYVNAARAALAAQPAASAEPSDALSENEWYDLAQRHATRGWNGNGYMAAIQAVCLDFLSRYGRPAREAQPAAWVAADTLNSPHPTCISSLAYMSQLDRERGREYVPLYAAPVAAQASADMFWSVDNPEEWGGESLHDAVHYAADNFSANDVPFELTFQAAKRMPNVRVRVTGYSESDGWQYEIIDAAIDAAMSDSAGEGGKNG